MKQYFKNEMYGRFRVNVSGCTRKQKLFVIAKFRRQNENAALAFDFDGSPSGGLVWQNAEQETAEFSK